MGFACPSCSLCALFGIPFWDLPMAKTIPGPRALAGALPSAESPQAAKLFPKSQLMRRRREIQFFFDSKGSCRRTRGLGGAGCPNPIEMRGLGSQCRSGTCPCASRNWAFPHPHPRAYSPSALSCGAPQKVPSSLSSHAEPSAASPSRLFPVISGAIRPWFVPRSPRLVPEPRPGPPLPPRSRSLGCSLHPHGIPEPCRGP